MSIFLVALTYFTCIYFILICVVKVTKIARMPVHLRWELAPLPLKKEKNRGIGSNFKGDESHNKQQKSLAAIVIYMAKEIFLQNGVWKHNRTLWPFSFSMHIGIYLVIISVLLHVLNALFIITGVPLSVIEFFKGIVNVIALAGYILGCIGAVGLIFKRIFDAGLRNFGTFSVYFRLVFLAAIFISGIFTWFYTKDFASTVSLFTRDLMTLDFTIYVSIPLAVHVIISLLFLIYLPLTDMTHFITKYFLYHAVRWNDEPLNNKMEARLNELKNQTADWAAPHIPSGKTWTEIAAEKPSNEKTT